MNRPLLSIVIPTKDRYYYLKHLLNYLIKLDPENIEIVLQDNSSDNQEFFQYVKGIDYPMLVYNHTKNQIPISLNSDLAINNSSGEFVSFIGDDDGVTSSIIDCVNWMEKNGVEIVLPSTVFYSWPDSKEYQIKGLDLSSKVSYKKFSGAITVKSSMEELRALMKRGCIDRGGIPLLYHGIVKRSTLDKIFAVCGTYFPGPSPDIANGVALCLVSDSFAHVDMPITIAGASKLHGGGIKKMKNRAADIDNVPFLPPNTKQKWEKKIPMIWTGETIWCESAVKAMRAMNRPDLADKVDYEQLYAQFSAFHYPLRKMAFQLTSNKLGLFVRLYAKIIKRYVNAFGRMLNLTYGQKKNIVVKDGLENIEAVVDYLDDYHYSFKKTVD